MRVTRIRIIKGEDKRLRFFLRNVSSKLPINLADATNVKFVFERQDRSEIVLDMVQIPEVKAFFNFEGGKFLAANGGSIGNSIILTFDGVKDIETVVDEWNTANPLNQVETHMLIDSFVPNEMQIRLDNGLDAYIPVKIENEVLGEVSLILEDKVTYSLRTGENQSFRIVIDFGEPPQGIRKKVKVRNILDVIT